MIHVSELSESRVNHPKEVVKEGDVLILRIIKIEPDRRRIGLSLRKVDSPAYADLDWKMELAGEIGEAQAPVEAEVASDEQEAPIPVEAEVEPQQQEAPIPAEVEVSEEVAETVAELEESIEAEAAEAEIPAPEEESQSEEA